MSSGLSKQWIDNLKSIIERVDISQMANKEMNNNLLMKIFRVTKSAIENRENFMSIYEVNIKMGVLKNEQDTMGSCIPYIEECDIITYRENPSIVEICNCFANNTLIDIDIERMISSSNNRGNEFSIALKKCVITKWARYNGVTYFRVIPQEIMIKSEQKNEIIKNNGFAIMESSME